MEREKLQKEILQLEKTILDHVEFTKKKTDSFERNFRLTSSDIDILFKNQISTYDLFIDLGKSIFSVSFTGYIALQVVDPRWVNATSQVKSFTVFIMAISLLGILLFLNLRKKIAKQISDVATKRINIAHELLKTEYGCLSETSKRLSELKELLSKLG